MKGLIQQIENTGVYAPWCFLGIFVAASLLMIWRLEAMSAAGFEGTVLGTLIMPYCSGIGNLIFALLIARDHGPGAEVMTNALVNNVTNLTLLIGLPALLWQATAGKASGGKGKSKKDGASAKAKPDTHRFSMLFTLLAVLFFTGAVWALGHDGKISFYDGVVLIGLFVFWQCFHVFEVLKTNASSGNAFTWMVGVNLVLLGIGAYASYVSINWLMGWLDTRPTNSFFSNANLGWLSGWVMVLPNAILALYYGWQRKPEVVYTSQVGDGHICIPLCIGLYALFHPLELPPLFTQGIYLIGGAAVVHLLFIGTIGKLPRIAGFALVIAYLYFLKVGLLK
ncbi:MAG: sodium:calcium symporter [Verrucomicrobiota bacterium]